MSRKEERLMKPGTDLQDVEARLRRLEVVNRVLVLGVCALGSLAMAGRAAPVDPPESLRTRGIEVVDHAGNVHVRITATTEGAEMSFLDAKGVERVALGHDGEDTAMYLKDAAGTTRAGVAQFGHGGGGFALHGEDSKGAAVLYLKGAKGTLRMFGVDGKVQHQFPGPS